jgi:hypothetical protein
MLNGGSYCYNWPVASPQAGLACLEPSRVRRGPNFNTNVVLTTMQLLDVAAAGRCVPVNKCRTWTNRRRREPL